MDKLTGWLEKRVNPIAVFFQENKYLASIQYGIMLSIPLLLVGAFACVISDFPVDAYQSFMSGLFGEEAWGAWNWSVLNPATIGLVALVAMCGTSYELARRNGVAPMAGVAITLMGYFILLCANEDGMVALSEFSTSSLFLALLVAIISSQVYAFCVKRGLTVKMPESVPAFVSDQFSALVPAALCAVLFLVVRFAVAATSYGSASALIFGVLQAPLTNIGTSLPGTLVMSFVNSVLWFFGIHGTNVVDSVMSPLLYAARDANMAVYAADATAIRPYIITNDFANMILYMGGTGITMSLCIEMAFFCKSERIKVVGKGAFIPGVFNVNEPVIFGLPLVMNPIMAIPFFIVPVVCVLVAYGSMAIGIVPLPTGVPVPWTMPIFFGGWMMTGSISGGLLQLALAFISGLIYWPFIKTLDRQYQKEEMAMQTAE